MDMNMKNFGKTIARQAWVAWLLAIFCASSLFAQEERLEPYRDWFGGYGYVDADGNIVIGCQFDDAKEFSEGLAAVLSRAGSVSEDGVFGPLSLTLKWGYIDTAGLTVIPCQFDFAGPFREGYAAVMSGNRWGFIDREGDTLVSYMYDKVRGFVNGYAAVCRGGLWGYIDMDGNESVPCIYDVAGDFGSDGFAAVTRSDSTGFVFSDGKWYGTKDRARNWIRGIPFQVYARDKVMNRVNEWQLQEPGEAIPDWEIRVNDETLMARLEGLEMRYAAEYVRANSLENPEFAHGPYDSLSGTFPVDIIDYGVRKRKFHVDLPVPVEDAVKVADSWDGLDVSLKYFIKRDRIAIARAEFEFPDVGVYAWTDPEYSARRNLLLNYHIEDLDFTLPGKIYRQMLKSESDTAVTVEPDYEGPVAGDSRDGSCIYAIIIANEDYTTGMTVPYALNDGAAFKDYCSSVLGVPDDQIACLTNAGTEEFMALLQWLDKVSPLFDADTRILLYFSGQCLLDKGVGETYLLPVDYSSMGVHNGLGMRNLYGRISQWNVDDALFLIDASYGKISRNGMRINVFKDEETPQEWLRPDERMVTVYAAGEDEAALPYPQKRHGLFTYFLLKALRQHPGICYGDLLDYVSVNVKAVAERLYGTVQEPQVYSSEWDGEAWREFSL